MILNIAIALVGWFAFNAFRFSMSKDEEFDKPGLLTWAELSIWAQQYTIRNVDNWLASAAFIPILLYLGHKGLAIPDFGVGPLQWSDAFYPCAGFITEMLMVAYKKWKSKS
jgi:hypothetical protein